MSADQFARKLRLLEAIMADAELSASAKCVAAVLLISFHNTQTGRCNPSMSALAARVGRTSRATTTAVHELERAEWLRIEGTGGGSSANTNRFVFDLDQRSRRVKSASPLKPAAPLKRNVGGVKCASDEPLRTSPPFRREEEGDGARERAPDGALVLSLHPGGELAEAFEEFWRHHPRPMNRKATRKTFMAIVTSGQATAAELINGAMRYAAEDRPFTYGTVNWLEEEKWADGPAPTANGVDRAKGRREKVSPGSAALEVAMHFADGGR